MIEALRELDPIAYLRYAIVYKNLNTLEAVRDEVDALIAEEPNPGEAAQAR
jgi:transcriptional repressor NrdR